MFLLGLTGGIGTGKSTASEFLSQLGYPVADTDIIAREVVAPGTPAVEEVRAEFGEHVLRSDGTLDRSRLAGLVFAEPRARERLEAILHPRIRREWQQRVEAWRRAGQPLAVVVIPLLYETAAETLFDSVLCVSCTAGSQLARLRQRGWTDDHIRQRLAAQLPLETKVQRADFVVWSEPPPAVHEEQIRCLLKFLHRVG